MKIQTGTYVGDGLDGHAITGMGFQPAFVLVKGSWRPIYKTASMASNKSLKFESCLTGGASESTIDIKTLDADGFTLGTGTRSNGSGITFKYVAIAADGSGDFAEGTYTGNGLDNRDITGVGFNPDFVLIQGEGIRCGALKHSSQTTDTASRIVSNTLADMIQAFIVGGFTIGTRTEVNADTVVYYWVAMLDSASADFKMGTYAGNGADDRSITGVGFQPSFVIVKMSGSTDEDAVFVTDDTTVGNSHYFNDADADSVDRIQALEADGFQIGTNIEVNENLTTFMYFAWRENSAPVTGTGVDRRRLLTRHL